MAKDQINPKFYDQLISKIKAGEPYDDMFFNRDPKAIADMLEEASAEYTKNKHPYDLFEKPELFKGVDLKIDPNLKMRGEAGRYVDKTTGLDLQDRPMTIKLADPKDKATLLHEAQHIYDYKSQPNIIQPKEASESSIIKQLKENLDLKRNINSVNDLKGLEEATQFYSKHFKPDPETKFEKLKQALNLERIIGGKGLKSLAPIMKAAGVGAIGASAIGIGNKASAGEYGGATLDSIDLATDLTPVLGEIKMAVNPTNLGNSELPLEEMEKREKFNKLNNLFNKGR